MSTKRLYIIAGCNGAGKTTAAYSILPNILNCSEFVNADEIARGLSPFKPESVAIEAGKLMLLRVDDLLCQGKDFAIETTLATRSYSNLVKNAQLKGYYVTLLFFWLPSPEMAKMRVAERVSKGGHNIPTEVIERRFSNGLKNLFSIYLPIVDELLVFDNSVKERCPIFKKKKDSDISIIDEVKYNKMKMYGNR